MTPTTLESNDAPRPWRDVWLGMVFPEVCQFCKVKRATQNEGFVCRECWMGVRFIRQPFCERCGLPYEGAITSGFECGNCHGIDLSFSFARSAVVTKGVVREAIHKFKYNYALWVEPFLSNLLIREAAPALKKSAKWDLMVPVPLHPAKLKTREYNQAEYLARSLSQAAGINLNTNLIRRVKSSETQTHLTREARMENVKRVFEFVPENVVTGKRIVVVDDVFTTGATTNACAAVLRKAGAAEVCVWTLARGV
jgi:ComF family protein